MHELKRAAFHVPYICITDNHYFVNNFNYFSSSISRNCFVWDRHDLNHEYVIPLMPQVFRLGSKLLRPTIWHAFIGSKTIIIEFMPLLEKKKGSPMCFEEYTILLSQFIYSPWKLLWASKLHITSRCKSYTLIICWHFQYFSTRQAKYV